MYAVYVIRLDADASFEQLSMLNQARLINCDALLEKINDISMAHSKSFHHPFLAPLNAMFRSVRRPMYSCCVVLQLFTVQCIVKCVM